MKGYFDRVEQQQLHGKIQTVRQKASIQRFLFFSFGICAIGYFSYQISIYTRGTDFSVFYCAAKIALDPAMPSSRVYDINALLSCNVPEEISKESRQVLHFIYSIPAAYILSPLSLLPYFHAKAVALFIEITSYIAAFLLLLKIVLHNNDSINTIKYYLLGALWLPFQIDILYSQINSFLFLFILFATKTATKKPFISGIIFGVVALFKLFPIGIAILFGIKNWRIAATCLVTVFVSLSLTHSEHWLAEVGNISSGSITPVYSLIEFNIYLYIVFVLTIAGITALLVLLGRCEDAFITSLAITALFIIMPVIEYHHLVLLTIPLFYILINSWYKSIFSKISIISVAFLITISIFFDREISQGMIYISCFILWISLIFYSANNKSCLTANPECIK